MLGLSQSCQEQWFSSPKIWIEFRKLNTVSTACLPNIQKHCNHNDRIKQHTILWFFRCSTYHKCNPMITFDGTDTLQPMQLTMHTRYMMWHTPCPNHNLISEWNVFEQQAIEGCLRSALWILPKCALQWLQIISPGNQNMSSHPLCWESNIGFRAQSHRYWRLSRSWRSGSTCPALVTMSIHGILPYPHHTRQHESNIHSSNHPWNL